MGYMTARAAFVATQEDWSPKIASCNASCRYFEDFSDDRLRIDWTVLNQYSIRGIVSSIDELGRILTRHVFKTIRAEDEHGQKIAYPVTLTHTASYAFDIEFTGRGSALPVLATFRIVWSERLNIENRVAELDGFVLFVEWPIKRWRPRSNPDFLTIDCPVSQPTAGVHVCRR